MRRPVLYPYPSRRDVLRVSTAATASFIFPSSQVQANPLLLAIIPALISGVASIIAASVQAREREQNEYSRGQEDLRQAKQDLSDFQAKAYTDREQQGRDSTVENWVNRPDVMLSYKIGYESYRHRPVTAPVCSRFGRQDTLLSFDDGFIRIDKGNNRHFMHGGEIEAAHDFLKKHGRMPMPLDGPLELTNRQQEPFRAEIARSYKMPISDFNEKYAILGSRPYSANGQSPDYWLHSVIDRDLLEQRRGQQVGFIETLG